MMTTLLLDEAALSVELNRLIRVALETRTKLLAFSRRAGTGTVAFTARSSAAVLTRAASELGDLVRRFGGRPAAVGTYCGGAASTAVAAHEEDLLAACEEAVAEVACRYRDALEWSLPEAVQEVLMRHFALIVANYERILQMATRRGTVWRRHRARDGQGR